MPSREIIDVLTPLLHNVNLATRQEVPIQVKHRHAPPTVRQQRVEYLSTPLFSPLRQRAVGTGRLWAVLCVDGPVLVEQSTQDGLNLSTRPVPRNACYHRLRCLP